MKQFNRKGKFERASPDRSDDRGSKRFGQRDSEGRDPKRFDRDDRPRFEKKTFDRKPFGRDDGEKKFFKAVCDKCGERCELPFKPSGDKPIYCRNCYNKQDERREKPDNSSKEHENIVKELGKINAKLDKILKTLNIE